MAKNDHFNDKALKQAVYSIPYLQITLLKGKSLFINNMLIRLFCFWACLHFIFNNILNATMLSLYIK